MREQEPRINPIANTLAHIVERDDVQRASLLIEVEKRHQSGQPWQGDDGEVINSFRGINWRQFWIQFATEHPWLTAFAPVAVVLYAIVIKNALSGG
jgi:hypothetical protein